MTIIKLSTEPIPAEKAVEAYVEIALRDMIANIEFTQPPMVSGLKLKNQISNLLIDIRATRNTAPQCLQDILRTIESSQIELQRNRAIAILKGEYTRPVGGSGR